MKWIAPLLLTAVFTADAAAQDLLGRAVGTDGEQVFVLKPGQSRGPAAVHVYRPGAGGWELVSRVTTTGAAEEGHALSPSLAVTGGRVLVASGDPNVGYGAHVFSGTTGAWSHHGSLALTDEPEAGPGTISLGSLMQLLQPAERVVAAHGDRAVTAVLGGRGRAADVRVFVLHDGSWTEEGRLEPADPAGNDGFGNAVAVWGDVILVGAPRQAPAGAVHIFTRHAETGAWAAHGVLTPDSAPEGAQFGSALAVGDNLLAVGAPAADGGTVYFFAHGDDGLVEQARFSAEPGTETRLGSAIAIRGTEVFAGAPVANERTGAVYRYERTGDGEWEALDRLVPTGIDARAAFGGALAVSDRYLVVGAPAADNLAGRAAVYTRAGDGSWGEPAWIRLGADLATVTGGEVRCDGGTAAGFSCANVDLQAYLTVEDLGGAGEFVTDIWGWTDPETDREYALVGRNSGLTFVDITAPSSPRVLGILASRRAGLRDVKTYRDHAFLVGDGAGNHGMVVFDLTRLRSVPDSFTTFEPDAHYTNMASAHNLVINTDAGIAIPVGSSGGGETCGGGLHMVDITTPTQPTFAGCFTDDIGLIAPGRTHDAQCVAYRGPDADHQGKQICFAANETGLRIVDVTDPASPAPIAVARYPGAAYVHQGWLTEDHRFFYMNDEADELVGTTVNTRTLVLDLEDLDDPVLVAQIQGNTGATDHNLYIRGDRMYQANYQGGLRVWDISDRLHPVEVGYFDTTPYPGSPAGMSGAWTAWPWFESGTVIVSSTLEGLFILKPRPQNLTP